MKRIRSDNGGEYTSEEFKKYCEDHGSIIENIIFWAEAVSTAAYVRNRSPTSSMNGKNPYEVWDNEKPNISHLKVAVVH